MLATAAVAALAAERPDVDVHVLTKPTFREIFAQDPGVSRVLDWNPQDGVAALGRLVRSGGYDRIVDLHGNLRSRVLGLLAPGVPTTRYRKGAWRRRLAVALHRPVLLDATHVVDRYLRALAPLGVSDRRRLPRVVPGETARARAADLLRSSGWNGKEPLLALAPGARWATKAWPEAHWAWLAATLADGGHGWPVVVGGAGDAALGGRILGSGKGANMAGRTSILETAAVLEACRVLVTNDSAPLHLATAVGTRVVALFGPTVAGFGFYPLGPGDSLVEAPLPCRPCSLHGTARCRLRHHQCLGDLTPDRVFAVVQLRL